MAQLAVLLIPATAGHQRGVLTPERRAEQQMLASVPRLIGQAMASASVIKTIVPRLAQSRSCLVWDGDALPVSHGRRVNEGISYITPKPMVGETSMALPH